MKTIIIFIIFIYSNIVLAQSNIAEIKYSVKDDIKSLVDTIFYKYDNSNRLIEQRLSYNEPLNLQIYSYDSKSRLSEVKYYKNSDFRNSCKYDYDQSGKLVKEKCLDVSGKLLFSNVLKYDSKGNLSSKKSNISTGIKIENTYDSQNRNFKSVISNNSRNQKEIEYIYDDNGKVIQETIYQSLKKSKSGKRYQQSKMKYIYDDSGKLKEKQNYLTEDAIEKYLYTYDDTGKLSKWEKFDTLGKLEFYVEYRYE